MGNKIGKLTVCFTGNNNSNRKHDISILITDPLDEGLGHSFCYVRPDPTRLSSSKVHSEETTTFRTISGASVSANTSTPLSTAFMDLYSYGCFDRAAAFESSTSFASLPLQPIPKAFSGNFGGVGGFPSSGPLERGFMSGPIERGFMSGPIDRGLFSGPIDKESSGTGVDQFQRSFSHSGLGFSVRPRSRKEKWIRVLQRAISKTLSRGQGSIVTPIKGVPVKEPPEWILAGEKHNENLTVSSLNLSSEGSLEDDDSLGSQNLQWAQGKAGEDRVHVVVSEEHGWVFVGIYDGFNGPDAPDYLLSNLYSFVHKELKGLLWDDGVSSDNSNLKPRDSVDGDVVGKDDSLFDDCSQCVDQEKGDSISKKKKRAKNSKNKYKDAAKKHEENQRRWKCEWDRERLELDRRLKEQLSGGDGDDDSVNHSDVLEALSRALRKTEESYLDVADKMVMENPELALMGSCVLVMLMKGEDVYVMNVGDSRAVLAQKAEPDYWIGKIRQDLERINEETMHDLESWDDADKSNVVPSLSAFQLTKDHSTNVEEVNLCLF